MDLPFIVDSDPLKAVINIFEKRYFNINDDDNIKMNILKTKMNNNN